LLYIEYPWFPAFRFKLFWGTPLAPAPKIEFVWPFSNSPWPPTTPLLCHLYEGKKSFDPPPSQTPVASVTSLCVQF
jgi:hypothetical protein